MTDHYIARGGWRVVSATRGRRSPTTTRRRAAFMGRNTACARVGSAGPTQVSTGRRAGRMMGRTQVPYAYICPTCRHQLNRHLLPQENPIEGPYVCPCGCEHMRAEQAVSINRTQFESGNYHDELPAAAAGEPSPPNPVPVSEFDEPHKWTGTP